MMPFPAPPMAKQDVAHIPQLFLAALCLLVSLPAAAVDVVGEVGAHFGGDTLVTVSQSDGSTDSLRAGEELSLAAGALFGMGQSLELTTTFGMKKAAVFSDNGAISFTRYPFNMLLLYKSAKWRIGGGLTVHMNPLYKVDTDTSKQKVGFKNALGYLFDVHYFLLDEVYIAARYTDIRYEVENDPTNTSYNGSSIGILVGVQL